MEGPGSFSLWAVVLVLVDLGGRWYHSGQGEPCPDPLPNKTAEDYEYDYYYPSKLLVAVGEEEKTGFDIYYLLLALIGALVVYLVWKPRPVRRVRRVIVR